MEYKVTALDFMQHFNRKSHEPCLFMEIRLSSSLNKQRLVLALEKVAGIFPLLKCRYDKTKNCFDELATFSPVSLVSDINDSSKEKLFDDLDEGAGLFRIRLSGHTVVFVASHIMTDGAGFKKLVYLVCDMYNGRSEENNGLNARELSYLGAKLRKSDFLKMIPSFLKKKRMPPLYDSPISDDHCLLQNHIQVEDFLKIKETTKNKGVTVNDVMMAAYCKALHDLYGLKKISFSCNSDLRKHTQNPPGIANLTGSYSFAITIKKGESFDGILASVHAVMAKKKASKEDLTGPYLLIKQYEKSSLTDFCNRYNKLNISSTINYTNLGVIDEKRTYFEDNEVEEASIYVCPQYPPYFQLAISTFKNKVTLSSLIKGEGTQLSKLKLLLKRVEDELLAFPQKR